MNRHLPAPSPALRAREQWRRRLLLLTLAIALLASLTPIVGRHLVGLAHHPLTGIDHVGALCLVALHVIVAPVHELLHLLVAGGLLYAAGDRTLAWWRARRVLAPLAQQRPVAGDPFAEACALAQLPTTIVCIVDGLPVPAFTAGWASPVIYVARALGEGARALPREELAAVLAHEHSHVVRRDPLRLFALRALSKALVWLPGLRALTDDVADEAEIRADDAAIRVVDRLALASALVSLGRWDVARPVGDVATVGVGFVRPDLLDRRVRRLAGGDVSPGSRLSRGSVLSAALLVALAWTSGLVDVHALAHPETASAEEAHCHHLHGSAWAHLFCRAGVEGALLPRTGSDCPHRVER
ncbi:MAG: M56 family metallopeptidase [Gemmatimonadaceae bacterium]|nr:M56 family metallopeptidase [Gemmatimonadaceae bacterium]